MVVGGGAAGHSAVQSFREAGGRGSVLLVSEDDVPPYNRPPLSKDYLRGETESSALPLAEPDFYADHDIEVRLRQSVVALDTARRTITTSTGDVVEYDRCVLALGSTPTELPVPGGTSALMLRWLEQARTLREVAQVATSAVVIGSGFIGCEAAASLAARGIKVTIVSAERLPQVDRLGPDAARLIARWLTDAGVVLIGSTEVSEITAGRLVHLSDGTTLPTDLILAATGVHPNADLAEQAGLEMKDGRIVVDAAMRTSATGVFAAGDAVYAFNTSAGRHLSVEHWGDADGMGTIAGTVAAGGTSTWSAAPGFWSEIGDHTLKYSAWGDGYDRATAVRHDNGGLTVWYSTEGVAVGVLTSGADQDYERGADLIVAGSPVPE